MYCNNCGEEIDDRADVCVYCGVSTNKGVDVQDNGGFLWGALGCCIPLVGLILFLVWNDTKPKTAKAAGMGALISVGSFIVFYVFAFVIGVGGAITAF